MATDPAKVRETRITEDYIVSQVNGYRATDSHLKHKKRIQDFDDLYWGNFTKLFPQESGLSNMPLVENKLKNATHDLARLASEAKASPVFLRQGEGKSALKRTSVRNSIANTIWTMGRGDDIQSLLYLDLIVAGYAALEVHFKKGDDYPRFMRLNPRYCYPDVMNGQLQNMLTMQTIKERQAAHQYPDHGLNGDAKNNNEVLVIQYFDDMESSTWVCSLKRNGDASKATRVSHWPHELGCVPVAFAQLDSADDTFHGLMDQVGGPMMIRNKIVRLLTDYLESMAHAPFESKGIKNPTDEPGPKRIYFHDENAEESFMRRIPPAAPAGAVFNLMGYMDQQEASETTQPATRVGIVQQSQASGTFVTNTQGTMSSLVKELQRKMASLRYFANYAAFEIDAKFLDRPKPLLYSVGDKTMYTPSKDMGGFYYHTLSYGASAGLNQAESDQRVQSHLAAGLISHETGRSQLDYIDDLSAEQDRIDREMLANAFFQRFAGDPRTPQSVIAKAIKMMNTGKTFLEVIEELEPDLFAAEQAAAQAGQPGAEQPGVAGQQPGSTGEPAPEGGGFMQEAPQVTPPTLLGQVITRNPV